MLYPRTGIAGNECVEIEPRIGIARLRTCQIHLHVGSALLGTYLNKCSRLATHTNLATAYHRRSGTYVREHGRIDLSKGFMHWVMSVWVYLSTAPAHYNLRVLASFSRPASVQPVQNRRLSGVCISWPNLPPPVSNQIGLAPVSHVCRRRR